ncbi:hypothetical protein Dimus_002602 [Dionaea muscipula]
MGLCFGDRLEVVIGPFEHSREHSTPRSFGDREDDIEVQQNSLNTLDLILRQRPLPFLKRSRMTSQQGESRAFSNAKDSVVMMWTGSWCLIGASDWEVPALDLGWGIHECSWMGRIATFLRGAPHLYFTFILRSGLGWCIVQIPVTLGLLLDADLDYGFSSFRICFSHEVSQDACLRGRGCFGCKWVIGELGVGEGVDGHDDSILKNCGDRYGFSIHRVANVAVVCYASETLNYPYGMNDAGMEDRGIGCCMGVVLLMYGCFQETVLSYIWLNWLGFLRT